MAHGGEVFVTKMRALRVTDLAAAMANQLSAGRWTMTTTGVRPGEKLYEELLMGDERERTLDVERLLIVLPPPGTDYAGKPTPDSFPKSALLIKEWSSARDTLMSVAEIEAYLTANKILAPFLPAGARS
jgi:FlaA1/EpsC-like NDP-sugar epimerase